MEIYFGEELADLDKIEKMDLGPKCKLTKQFIRLQNKYDVNIKMYVKNISCMDVYPPICTYKVDIISEEKTYPEIFTIE